MTTATIEKKAGDTLSESERAEAALATLAERGQREGVERSVLRSLSDPMRDALADFERGTIDDLPPEVSGKARTDLQLKTALLIREGFEGNIKGLMNDKYSRANLKLRIHEMIGIVRAGGDHGEGKNEAIEYAKRSAFFQFDLDGLKAVNDLGSMALGNVYLAEFGKAMNDVKEKIEHDGAHVALTRDGGDEFGFFVSFNDRFCTEKEIHSIVTAVQEAFAKRTAGILNVQDSAIRAKIEGKGLQFSEDIAFHGTVSGGGISIYEALVDGHDYVESADGYQRSLDVLAGDVMRERAIERAKKQKTLERLRWAKGTEQEQFHAAILNTFRGVPVEEVERLEQKYADIQDELARVQAENAELRLALQAKDEDYAKERAVA
ncbi:hypothetical protein HY624_02225 [Candidatus Uhrbacteria bacterium]|nr:hypothetical protein [Candidatus Uhrbacteria bacterium]